jgi:tetratricopeptide (TPR) repeat protein
VIRRSAEAGKSGCYDASIKLPPDLDQHFVRRIGPTRRGRSDRRAQYPEHRLDLVLSYLGLVSLLWELGRQTEAAEPFRKDLELDPEDPVLNNDLAWFLATRPELRLRDAAQAVRLARKAVTAGPESANYRNMLGVALYRNGDDRAAIAELETSMSMHAGGNSLDWFFLAMAHGHPGDRKGADLIRPRRAVDG